MELRILGPFEVFDDSGRRVKLPTGRESALLAVLLLRRGEVVSTDALVDALWGEEPPSTAAKAVQGYVSHLRRVLEQSGQDGPLQTRPPGYLLRIDDSRVDARRFEKLAAEGWRLLDDDPESALATFEEALGFWRGPALGEFAFAEFAQPEIHRLEELRLETIEGRIEGLLRLGRHEAVVAELQTRVEEHPLRERLRGQLMLALYRSGRQADALDLYRRGRRLLADELGLDPGSELQRLEKAILDQDPALDAPQRRPTSGRARITGAPPETTPEPALRPARRRLRVVGLGVVLLAVALGASALAYVLVRDEAPASALVAPPALVVVDPASNRVVASIAVGSRPVTVVGANGSIWVGDAQDGTATEVDSATRKVVKVVGVGSPVVDLAFGTGGVWGATGGFGEVVRIDPELRAITARRGLGDPGDPVVPAVSAIGVGDGRVWVGAFDGLAEIDPSSALVMRKVDLGRSSAFQVAVGGGAVWGAMLASRAKRVEARSALETAEFYAGSPVYAVALGGGALWAGGATGQVWKVDPVTGAALLTARAVEDVSAVAPGEDAVWVTSFRKPQLVRLDPVTGDVEATIPIGGPAEDVAVHDGLVWVPVRRP